MSEFPGAENKEPGFRLINTPHGGDSPGEESQDLPQHISAPGLAAATLLTRGPEKRGCRGGGGGRGPTITTHFSTPWGSWGLDTSFSFLVPSGWPEASWDHQGSRLGLRAGEWRWEGGGGPGATGWEAACRFYRSHYLLWAPKRMSGTRGLSSPPSSLFSPSFLTLTIAVTTADFS